MNRSPLVILLCALLLACAPTLSLAQKGEANVFNNKPYYTLLIEGHDVFAGIVLNGQEISQEKYLPSRKELPVGDYIQSGKNTLEMQLVTDDDPPNTYKEQATMKVSLRVNSCNQDRSKAITLATLDFSGKEFNARRGLERQAPAQRLDSRHGFMPDRDGDVIVSKAWVEKFVEKSGKDIGDILLRTVTLPETGLPRWAWLDSDPITGLKRHDLDGWLSDQQAQQLLDELLPIYTKIWKAIESGDIESVLPLFEERNREADIALCRPSGETASVLAHLLKESSREHASGKSKLWPIKPTNTMVFVYDNDRLARLRQNNYEPLVALNFKGDGNFKGGGSETYEIILRKKDGKWIITR